VTHFDNPGHTLFSVSALCIIGGYVISLVPARELILASVVILNVLVFFDNFPVSPGGKALNVIAAGTYESTLGWVKNMDEITKETLEEINAFTPADRPSTIITTESYQDRWFMNWRIGRYYLPNRDIWGLDNGAQGRRFGHIRRTTVLGYRDSPPFKIPVFRESRILFILEPNGRILRELAGSVKLSGARYVSYVDVARDSPSFTVDGFEIVPSDSVGIK